MLNIQHLTILLPQPESPNRHLLGLVLVFGSTPSGSNVCSLPKSSVFSQHHLNASQLVESPPGDLQPMPCLQPGRAVPLLSNGILQLEKEMGLILLSPAPV